MSAKFLVWILLASLQFGRVWARDPIAYDLPADRRHSVVLVLWNSQTTEAELSTYLDRIQWVGAKHVTIPFFGCQTSATSNDVGGCEHGIQPLMERAARLAHSKGLTVSLLPIVLSLSGEWRGFFNPTDAALWFSNYAAWMKKVAKVAREVNSPDLVVGTEFGPIYKFAEPWKELLRDLRKNHFSKPLVMTVNWDLPDVGFWDEADAIGVSHYFPLATVKNPSEADLLQGTKVAKGKLLQLAQNHRRPLHLTEVGYPSFVGAAAMPWGVPLESQKPQKDWAIQASCYQAFFKTWQGTSELVHVGLWATGETYAKGQDYGYEFFGKPAQNIVVQLFKGPGF